LMAELDAIKKTTISGLVFRRDHEHRKSRTPPALDDRTQGLALPSRGREGDYPGCGPP
jgi:hypothetical protein